MPSGRRQSRRLGSRKNRVKILFLHNGYESLGIEYLSASLKAAGFETALVIDPRLFDEAGFWHSKTLARAFSFREQALRQAEKYGPDVVAFSVFTDTFPWAVSMAREIKKRTGAKIVFGGIHASSAPEAALAEDCVDFVCLGEGDRALPALAKALETGSPALPAGILARREGGIIKGPPPVPPADLDALPFPDKALFRGAAPLFSRGYLLSTSRGCPHACAYCCNSVYSALYRGSGVPSLRRRSPENVLRELEAATSGRSPGFLHFTDEVFNSDYAWLENFLPLYKKRIGLPFSCYAFPDDRLAAFAAQLAEAGCFKVQLGVQRFDEGKRAGLLNRRSSNAAIAAALAALKKAGVYSVCDNILGLPDETPDELDALLRFYHDNTPDAAEVFFLKYYPGTPLFEKAVGEGLLTSEEAALIRAGLGRGGIIKGGGDAAERCLAPLLLFPLLPRFLRSFLLEKRRYLRFPRPGNIALRTLARLLRRPRHDFHTEQFARTYLHFALRKFI